MSYDLYFYKKKEAIPSNQDLQDYLTNHLVAQDENSSQWFFENKDTEVYFSFDENEPEDEPETIELFESFEDYDNTHITFEINFIRPDFFGIEAFSFVDKLIEDLNLFVLNPQSGIDPDNPLKPDKGELYQNWSITNLKQSASLYEECALNYYPLAKSNSIWEYNYQRNILQDKLGDEYFVPKIFFFKLKKTGQIITVSSWTENIPCVLPNVDFYLIIKKYKSLFRDVEESGIISAFTLFNIFSGFLDKHDENCKIIYPHNTIKTKKIFNNLKLDLNSKEFMERMSIEKIVNSKPE